MLPHTEMHLIGEHPPLQSYCSTVACPTQDGTDALLALTRQSLQSAVRTSLGFEADDILVAQTRTAVRAMCELAHARGMRAEQLLLLMKETWCSIPLSERNGGTIGDAALARLITHCIEQYYEGSN